MTSSTESLNIVHHPYPNGRITANPEETEPSEDSPSDEEIVKAEETLVKAIFGRILLFVLSFLRRFKW